jgi:hypothetical protein
MQDNYLKIMHHLFKFFPVDKDKEFVFLWQWNSHSFLQDYESAWWVSWVPCASIFKSRKWWNVFIMSRKLVMWIFTVMRAADLVGDDVIMVCGVLIMCSLVSGYKCSGGTCCLHLQKGWTFYQKKNLISVALWHILTWAVIWHFLMLRFCQHAL